MGNIGRQLFWFRLYFPHSQKELHLRSIEESNAILYPKKE